jgi:signal transduction histidine kinase
MRDTSVADAVDVVLTFNELLRMFQESGIEPEELPISDFDGPRSYIGRSFPISGGLVRTAGLSNDILESDVLITEGKEWVISALKELEANNCQAKLFDILFCEGCINGPEIPNDLSIFARKEILANFIREQNRYITKREFIESLAEFENLDLKRTFDEEPIELPLPSEEEIQRVLQAMRKFGIENHLNCGACGYVTCREKAIAVCQGLAEPDMCLPYVVEELEATCQQLQESHEELFSAQQRLVQTEKLASMGQISAGVAHEINNPLGTILLYSHMLLKQLSEEDDRREDFEMIANEATRCKTIVRGLLDFARQSRISKTPTDLTALVQEAMMLTAHRAQEAQVTVSSTIPEDLPIMMIDGDQIKQMLINLINNGIDAINGSPGPREVTLKVGLNTRKTAFTLEVSDTGCGISQENQSKLFTPFFTTKEMGKGTGLGLAITYGVVKMHSGDISVESEEGHGATFFISIPLETVDVVS